MVSKRRLGNTIMLNTNLGSQYSKRVEWILIIKFVLGPINEKTSYTND